MIRKIQCPPKLTKWTQFSALCGRFVGPAVELLTGIQMEGDCKLRAHLVYCLLFVLRICLFQKTIFINIGRGNVISDESLVRAVR